MRDGREGNWTKIGDMHHSVNTGRKGDERWERRGRGEVKEGRGGED